MSQHTNRPSGTYLEILRTPRKLRYYNGNRLSKTYPVAVGKHSTPTPLGNYKVVNKVINPGSILGTRWMGLNIPGGNYGIHGTNNPSSIGKFISNGCIRMYNRDVEELFPQISLGTPVIITEGTDNPTPGPQEGKRYVVRPGDTLWKIAQNHGVSLDSLILANNLTNPDILTPGQVLIIP